VGTGAYEIDDGAGTLWVITPQSLPGRDMRIGVK
jgi:hypothetical protein